MVEARDERMQAQMRQRLHELQLEHRDLDRAIEALELNPLHDELQLKRLKKRKLMLKDLGSLNGTFLYDGKEFQRVSDSVEVKPNNVLKFGTGTIVKLVSE